MPYYVIKKNSTSVLNPWLGTMPHFGNRELFAKASEFLGCGGQLKVFSSVDAATSHIKRNYPEDVGVMQVCEMVDSPNQIEFRPVS